MRGLRPHAAAPLIALVFVSLTGLAGARGLRGAEFDGERAFGYLEQICSIGRRVSGSEGMTRQQQILARHFTQHEASLDFQTFQATHPLEGTPVRMANLIVSWHPASTRRILICCHYDTRPYPDRDLLRPRGLFLGANDGGSGVAVLMELAHHIRELQPAYGVDFVFFDGEELVFRRRGDYFLGSTYFAKRYRDRPPQHRYVAGVLLDMVGDRNLVIYQEKNSTQLAPQVTQSVWAAAQRAGVREFVPRVKHEVSDDHIPLNTIARIPTCDVIDFDFRYWHTTRDVPENCSAESLSKVGRVVMQWIEDFRAEANDATQD